MQAPAIRHQFREFDGLRGVAALSVMLFHRKSWLGAEPLFQHGGLAVDFFFMLSGFVIAHAYGDRLADWPRRRAFGRDRVIRLHPMLLAGAVLGAVALGAQVHAGTQPAPVHPVLTLIAALVPFPATWNAPGAPFPIDGPAWSLFWEIAVNIVYALVASRLSGRWLALIVGAAAVAMLLNLGTPASFDAGWRCGDLVGGVARVSLSFFAGVALLRGFARGWRVPLPDWPGVPAVLLVASFTAWPKSQGYDAMIVMALYPLLLLWSAAATPRLPRVAQWLGAISYPLYLLHVPVLLLLNGARQALIPGAPKEPGTVAALLCLATVPAVSAIALKLYDEPVRAWLRRRWGSRPHRTGSAAVDPGRG